MEHLTYNTKMCIVITGWERRVPNSQKEMEMDFMRTFQEINTLHVTIAKKERELAEKSQALHDVCKPVCISAARKCNQRAQLRIILDSFQCRRRREENRHEDTAPIPERRRAGRKLG